MRERILFVDDDENVLQSLQQLLAPMSEEWEMAFSVGGEDALEKLRQNNYSVIISDIINKNEDGIRLMEQVKKEFPNTARVILSSNLESAQLHHAADQNNFYLLKGCSLDDFIAAIRDAIELHSSLMEHPRPLSNEDLTEVLVDYFKRELLFQKMTMNDIPELIRPYISRAMRNATAVMVSPPFMDEEPVEDQSWIGEID